MSGFTDEERATEAAKRTAANLARNPKPTPYDGPTGECVHCGRSVPVHEISADLCDYCFHKG